MLHSLKEWKFIKLDEDFPDINKEVLGLIEYDSELKEDLPFVRKLILEKGEMFRWHLVDYDPEYEEKYLQQYITVIMWRYL